jgi:DNA-binding response OmpR family regulator
LAKILIVDDDPQLRQSFEKLLLQEEHTVQTAATAETGLNVVGESPPDLVIMDVRLPGMNGLDWRAQGQCEKLRPRYRLS